jgi:hypothetical protein
LLRDTCLDTNVVTQNKQNKIRTAALILTFFFSIFLSSVLSFLSAARTFFFNSKFFFEQQELRFVLSFSLFFSSNTKTLYTRFWNKMILKSIEYLEQPQAQIWAKVSGGSEDDQL